MTETPDERSAESEESESLSWPQAIVREVRDRPVVYAVFAGFVIAGPIVVHVLFPDAPRGVGLLGGLAFGAYAALTAMPGRML